MKDMSEILENVAVDAWSRHFLRATHQVNRPHETDSEIVEIPGSSEHYLAVTIDTVSEEITTGLYRSPFTMGWIAVMASLSDLAAVGADPLGLVISTTVDPGRDRTFVTGVAQGMEQACRLLGVHILGGDTNAGPVVSLTGCAVGIVPRDGLMTRVGCKPGDAVFATGGAGKGNAFGLVRLGALPETLFPEDKYRPVARLAEGRVLRGHVSCCMDTSDGLLATLDQLMRLNRFGFEVDSDWSEVLAPDVWRLSRDTGTPPWLFAAGPHGEFELLFTVPEEETGGFLRRARAGGVNPVGLGRVQQAPRIALVRSSGKRVDVDMTPIRNLLETVGGDPGRYMAELRAYGSKLGLE